MKIEVKGNLDGHYVLTFETEKASNGKLRLTCVSSYGDESAEAHIDMPGLVLLELCEALHPWLKAARGLT